jgi:putative membrane protein
MVVAHGLAAISHWTWEPFTILGLTVSALVYVTGLSRLWRRAGPGRGIARWQAASFAAGVLTLALALLSPIAWLSEQLFSAHMTQHELLMLIAAPLLVMGQPGLVALWSLSPAGRARWSRWTRRRATMSAWRTLTAPASVFVMHAAALWIWHVPALYEAALAHAGIHAVQHLSFTGTAALFWWSLVHGRYGRSGYGAAVVYVFLTAVHSSILGALMTVAPRVWYPTYLTTSVVWDVDPLGDQQLAGLVMWVPTALLFIVFGLGLFAAWLGESERRAALGSAIVTNIGSSQVTNAPQPAGEETR